MSCQLELQGRVYKSLKSKKKKAFTLIEVLLALAILSIVTSMILPSLASLFRTSRIHKNKVKTIYALEEAIEVHKDQDLGAYLYETNGLEIQISIKDYDDDPDFKEITATYGDKFLDLVVEK